MKCICLVIYSLVAMCCFSQEKGRTKHALLIAIGNYPGTGGWPKLSSLHDLDYIEAALQGQGFEAENIHTVTDEKATIQGISDAFGTLIQEVSPGDVVVIHFSCHGEQVRADNDNKPGGLDECVVTYNAVSPFVSTDFQKDQAAYLRGHSLGSLIARLREKLGPAGDVVVFLDFCHSGGGTRGRARIRGGQPPLVPKGWRPPGTPGSMAQSLQATATRGRDRELAAFTVFSATRPEELDMETEDDQGKGVGSLTYAVCKTFERLEAGMTYRMLFAKVQAIMNVKVPSQHPLLEGDGADRLLFGGGFVEQKPWFGIVSLGEGNRCTVKAGLLAGLDSGAQVSVYPAGTSDPSGGVGPTGTVSPVSARLLAEGTVLRADNYTSVVQLDRALSLNRPVEGWVFVTSPVYRIRPIPMAVVGGKDAGLNASAYAKLIATALKDLPLVTFAGEPELLYVKGQSKDTLKIAGNGYVFGTIKKDTSAMTALGRMIKRYAQYKFLQQLDLRDREAIAEVRLIPLVDGKPDTAALHSRTAAGMCTFKDGDKVVVQVKNTGRQPIYINMLDLQPDGVVNPLLPNQKEGIYSYDLKVAPGEVHLFSRYTITISPPYGTEVFKVFTSLKEIDMEGVARAHGAARAGKKNPTWMEELVKDSYNLGTRGGHSAQGGSGGSAFNILFNIEPQK